MIYDYTITGYIVIIKKKREKEKNKYSRGALNKNDGEELKDFQLGVFLSTIGKKKKIKGKRLREIRSKKRIIKVHIIDQL